MAFTDQFFVPVLMTVHVAINASPAGIIPPLDGYLPLPIHVHGLPVNGIGSGDDKSRMFSPSERSQTGVNVGIEKKKVCVGVGLVGEGDGVKVVVGEGKEVAVNVWAESAV